MFTGKFSLRRFYWGWGRDWNFKYPERVINSRGNESSNLRTHNFVQWGKQGKVFHLQHQSLKTFFILILRTPRDRNGKFEITKGLRHLKSRTSNKLERFIAYETEEMINVSVFMPGMPRLFFYAGQIFELVLRKWNEQRRISA